MKEGLDELLALVADALAGEQRLSGDGAEHREVVTADHDIAVSGF